jgi:hypothetical protein
VNDQELNRLIQELLDGTISPQDLPLLETELASNESARELYLDTVEIHSLLDARVSVHSLKTNVVPIERIIRCQKRKAFRIAVLSAAALLILGLITMQLFMVKERPPTLTFETAPGTQFDITHSMTGDDAPIGMTMEKGSRLMLSHGTVELSFGTGVKSIVIAPADMTLHDDNKLYLNQGTAWFHVPEGAEGFQVTTDDLDIVDLGTEFGVIATPNDHDELHVFKGKVKVAALRVRKESNTLTAGQARRIDPIGRLVSVKPEIKKFLTVLPTSLPAYSGPMEFTDGTHSLGEGGVSYTVSSTSDASKIQNRAEGDMVIHAAGGVSVDFAEAVDIQISAGNIPDSQKLIWNSEGDFGDFSIDGGSLSQLHDPNKEILFEPDSDHSFRWKFFKPHSDKFRMPSLQTWRIELKGVRKFEFSKDATSPDRSSFNFQITSPSH